MQQMPESRPTTTCEQRPGIALLVAVGVVGLLAVAGVASCSDAPCEEAADRLERCLQRLDCRDVGPTERGACITAVEQGTRAVEDLRSLPCAAQLRDKADEINRCPIEQVPFCNCFVL